MSLARIRGTRDVSMVYNRRKEKVSFAVQMHEAYLAIPNRLEKEKNRISARNPTMLVYRPQTETGPHDSQAAFR